jgi:hypothetical protein
MTSMIRIKTTLAVALSVAAVGAVAPVAHADLSIIGVSGATSINGQPSRQAGAHPDFTTTLTFAPEDSVRDVQVDLPPGLLGDPMAAPTCSFVLLTASDASGTPGGSSLCPLESQVGVATVYDSADLNGNGTLLPLYNLQPEADEPGAFGFNFVGVIVRIVPRVRPTDYGITADVASISQGKIVKGSKITLWGVPADPSHDAQRFLGDTWFPNLNHPSSSPRLPFMTSPTSCSGVPAVTSFRADSWEHTGVFSEASFSADPDGTPFITDGCERLSFRPSIAVRPAAQRTDAPTGLDIDLNVPQSRDPDGLATAHLRRAVITLPKGFTVSPSSAQGLGACALSDIKLGVDVEPVCPDSSKLGTVTVQTPLLKDPLEGDVILAKQTDNPFKSLLAMYLVVRGPGILIKLPGRIDADPVTGQLVTTFDNQPQVPFSKLTVHLRGGSRAPLASPESCGTYSTHAELTSWASDVPVVDDAPLVIDQGCGARGFSPTFSAGVTDPIAGGSSPFTLTISRKDGEQYFQGLNVALPPGLLGNVGSVARCPEVQAAAGTCGVESQVGTTSVLSGPGDTPLSIPEPGKAPTAVYLAGPYKGAPFSLSIVVPAQAGPFDLGNVVVRAALFIDSKDAHATVKSDPFPTIVQGIPLRMRQINVMMDRPGFMQSPTSCAPLSIAATIFSVDGTAADVGSPFRVGHCADLGLSPKLSIGLSGKGQTSDGKHPSLVAKLTQPVGQANIKKVAVSLPLGLALDPDNSQSEALCEFDEGQKDEPNCPTGSIVGSAKAISPLLDEPLEGPIYFVKNVRIDKKSGRRIRTLPTLAIALQGEGVHLVLRATTNVVDDKLVTTFDNVPDAPVSSFTLTFKGGKKGILVISDTNVCKTAQVADQVIYGQNNRLLQSTLPISASDCPLKVVSKRPSRGTMALKVGGLGAGTVTISGANVRKVTRKLDASSVATLQTSLTAKGKAALQRRRRLATKVKITFKPQTGRARSISTSMLWKSGAGRR